MCAVFLTDIGALVFLGPQGLEFFWLLFYSGEPLAILSPYTTWSPLCGEGFVHGE